MLFTVFRRLVEGPDQTVFPRFAVFIIFIFIFLVFPIQTDIIILQRTDSWTSNYL